MAERLQVYKCNIGGNIVEVTQGGPGELVCCNQRMVRQAENTVDAAQEKHVPVAEKADGGFNVKVGSVPHPMEDKHYIQWVEILAGDRVCRLYLKPGEAPEAYFPTGADAVTARAYCNLHGHWKS